MRYFAHSMEVAEKKNKNKRYKPIPFGPEGRILGKVVTVLRRV